MSDFQAYIRARVEISGTGCWLWRRYIDRDGYGEGCFNKRKRRAHRLSYEAFKGAIPDGMQIDHICRVRSCVNPDHLEAVTAGENTRRAIPHRPDGFGVKAECKRGHSFSEHGVIRKDGSKQCRECDRIRSRDWYARNPERVHASYDRRRGKILAYKAEYYRKKKG